MRFTYKLKDIHFRFLLVLGFLEWILSNVSNDSFTKGWDPPPICSSLAVCVPLSTWWLNVCWTVQLMFLLNDRMLIWWFCSTVFDNFLLLLSPHHVQRDNTIAMENRHVTITMEQSFQTPIFCEMITTCQSTRIYAFERNNYKLIWEKCINYYNNLDFGIFTILFFRDLKNNKITQIPGSLLRKFTHIVNM